MTQELNPNTPPLTQEDLLAIEIGNQDGEAFEEKPLSKQDLGNDNGKKNGSSALS